MKKNLLVLSSIILLFLAIGLISAEIEENYYISFEGSNAHVKQVTTFYATGGYYLPTFTYSDVFYTSQKNLQIHDSQGKMPVYKIIEQNESYTVYNITIPQVGSTHSSGYDLFPSVYYIYYEYDLENVLSNYLKNFEANIYMISNDGSYKRRVYFCLPSSYSSPIPYDSRPYEERSSDNPYQLNIPKLTFTYPTINTTTIIPIGSPKEPEPNFCINGNKKLVISSQYTAYSDLASYKWSDSNSDKILNEIQGNTITISVPQDHSENLAFLKRTEEALPFFNTIGLEKQDHYYIYFVDSDDKVLTYPDEGIVCYEDGKCYISNKILLEDKQFQSFNIVKSYFLSSLMKKYGQNLDTQNWYVQGASDYLTYKAFKYANLESNKIQEFLDMNMSEEYGEDIISEDIEEQTTMIKNIKMVTEVEDICPDHLQDVLYELNNQDIINQNLQDAKINSFILIFYGKYCDVEKLFPLFEKYNMSFEKDKVSKYLEVSEKLKKHSLNIFKSSSERELQTFLMEDYNYNEHLQSALYWEENGAIYTICLVLLFILIFGGIIFYKIKNKPRIIRHSHVKYSH